jgi:hypothetical protein
VLVSCRVKHISHESPDGLGLLSQAAVLPVCLMAGCMWQINQRWFRIRKPGPQVEREIKLADLKV